MTDLLKTPNIGTGALEDRDRVRFSELRRHRLRRLLDAMERDDLDVCLFGREANARYATGVRRLWTAQTRPFVPACIVVRATGRARLMSFSASYEGIPEELSPDDFFAVTWNPMRFVEHVTAAPGVTDARRVGVDGMMPMFQALLGAAMPKAALVGVEPMMRELRRRKLPEEINALRIAAAVAESALAEAARNVRPGVSERELQAAFFDRMCHAGTTQFSHASFTVIDPHRPLSRITGDRVLEDGDLVALCGGALWNGYEGTLARTWWCGSGRPSAEHRRLHERWRALVERLVDTCRPGATGADLRSAHDAAGEPLPDRPFVYAIGLGHEGPIAGSSRELDREQRIEAGMVLAVRTEVSGDAGTFVGEEMIHVGDGGPELMTTMSHGALAKGASND